MRFPLPVICPLQILKASAASWYVCARVVEDIVTVSGPVADSLTAGGSGQELQLARAVGSLTAPWAIKTFSGTRNISILASLL